MSSSEFAELVQMRIVAEASSAVLPQLSALRSTSAERVDTGLSDLQLGEKKVKKKKKKSSRDTSLEVDVEKIAARWAELQETVRRLQSDRHEVQLRRGALQAAAGAEVARCEALSLERERDLATSIAEERARQAELSVTAEKQRHQLDAFLRAAPASLDHLRISAF